MTPEELLIKKKVTYLPKGKDLEVRCFNPKHDDKNPSMRIDKLTGIFHCLSCGFRGNLFTHFGQPANFLEQRRQKLKNKILEKLSENVGLNIPENAIPYQGNWRGISPDTYKKFGAFQHNASHFIGRIVIPIVSIADRIVGFNGRHTTNELPKYLIYPSGAKLPLFPAKPNQYNSRVILVEGMYDMLNLHDKGLDNAVCTFGTMKLRGSNADKLNILKLQGVTGIDILFDPDKAGQEAAEELKEICENYELSVRIINLKSKDPGELTAQEVIRLKERLYGE